MMSAAHDISSNVLIYMYVKYLLDLIHRVWGAKLSLLRWWISVQHNLTGQVLNSHFSLEFFTYIHTYMALFVNASLQNSAKS